MASLPNGTAGGGLAGAVAGAATPNNGVYWIGADGNYYVKNASGVKNMGSEGIAPLYGLTQIDDPNPPAGPVNSNGTAGTGPTTADKSNDITLQNSSLDALDPSTNTGLSQIDQALAGLKGKYATEATQDEGIYSDQSDKNTQNLEKNREVALVNAAQGRQGLFGTLSSLGALNGSGIVLANRAVQKGANDDLTGAADDFGTNKDNLDTSINLFRTQNDQRNKDADSAAASAKTAVQNNAAKTRQTLLSNLANDYAAEGDSANAAKFTAMAAALSPDIGNTSAPDISNLTPESAAFTAPTLQNYLAGSNSTAVSTTPAVGGGLPGLVATNPLKKKATATA